MVISKPIPNTKGGPTPHAPGLCESLEQGSVVASSNQSSGNALPSLSLMNTVESEHSVFNEIADWLSRKKDSSCLNPVPDQLDDPLVEAGEDCATQSVSSRTPEKNSESLDVPRSAPSTPEPEDPWIIDDDDEDVQSCLGNTTNVDSDMREKREKKDRPHLVQGMIGMSLNVMRDYYAIGPEATRKKACYAPFYGYFSKKNHQDEEDEGFRFDKKAYLKMFVHKDALVPEQPEYIGRNVLDEAVLWPNDPGSDVPNEDTSLENTLPPDCPCESEVEVSADLDKLNLPAESETEPANRLKAEVPAFAPPSEIRDVPVPHSRTHVASDRLNEAQSQAQTPSEMSELKFTIIANPSSPKQSRRISGPRQQNESVLAPIQLNRGIPGLSQHIRNIPGPSKRYENIPGPIQLNANIPGPSHGYCYPMDLRDKLRENYSKLLRVNSTSINSTKPVNQLKVPHVPVFPPPNEIQDQSHVMPQRYNVDFGIEAQFHTPQKQSRPSHACYPNPKDLKGKLNVRLASRNTAIRGESPVPSNSTNFPDSDSSDDDDDDRPRRRRFVRTVVSPTRRRLFSLSKGIMPQDDIQYAEPLKAEPAPKPSVTLEKELNVDEWGEELDYELGSDDEEGSDHTSNELHNNNTQLQGSLQLNGRSSADDEDSSSRNPCDESQDTASISVGQAEVHELAQTFGNL